MKSIALILCFGLLSLGTLFGQETSRFTFAVGGGFTQPVGNTGRNLDQGWNIQGGVGYNFAPFLGLVLQTDYNRFDINGATLTNLGVPGGDVGVFSATLNPIIHLNPHGHIDFYLIGGGGLYHRNQEFTAPGLATVAGFNPFFGFFPVTVPTTQILASDSINKPGVNGGAGFAIGTKWHGKIFAEARYHRIFMPNDTHTDYIPVTFGFRW